MGTGCLRLTVALLLWAGLQAMPAWAQTAPAGDAQERARIARERKQIDARFEREKRECKGQFAATACLDAALAKRRQALEPLRRAQAVLDAQQRRQRAAARMQRIEEKMNRSDEAGVAAQPVASAPAAKVRIHGSARPARSPSTAHGEAQRQPRGEAAAQAADKRESYEQRQSAIRAHREAVERRNAERAAHRRPAPPLPVPSGAASGTGAALR